MGTTFLLSPSPEFHRLVGVLLPESLHHLCRWDSATHLVYCDCTSREVLAPLHISIAGARLVIHGRELLKKIPGSGQCVLRVHMLPSDMPGDVFVLGEHLLSRHSMAWDLKRRHLGLLHVPSPSP